MRRLLALAERRRAHLIDLLESRRWQNYVADADLEEQLYELDRICERFAEISGIGAASTGNDDPAEQSSLVLLPGNLR